MFYFHICVLKKKFFGVTSLNDPAPTQSGLFTNEQVDKGLQYWPGVVFFIIYFDSLVLHL